MYIVCMNMHRIKLLKESFKVISLLIIWQDIATWKKLNITCYFNPNKSFKFWIMAP